MQKKKIFKVEISIYSYIIYNTYKIQLSNLMLIISILINLLIKSLVYIIKLV